MKTSKRRGLCVSLTLLLSLSLLMTSCGKQTEPEQVYLVSAVGFDRAEEGIRVTVEVPVMGESKDSESKTMVLTETGKSITDALRTMGAGLSRSLLFSHCALAVLGETLSKEQLQAVFDFAGDGDSLPLAAGVVTAADAGALLEGGSLSAPAVGYEIPEILEQERYKTGVDIRCSVYELRAVSSPDSPIPLPRFEALGKESVQPLRFAGLDVLRSGAEPFRISREECVSYAILSDRFTKTEDTSPVGMVRLRNIRTELTAQQVEGGLQFRLTLRMDLLGGSDSDAEQLRRELCTETEKLFERVRATAGADLFSFGERLKRESPELWETVASDYGALFQTSSLAVTCEITVAHLG